MDLNVADYAEHLTEADLRLLSTVAPRPGAATIRLARDPAAIEDLLADPRVFEAVFGPAAVAAAMPSWCPRSWPSAWRCTAP